MFPAIFYALQAKKNKVKQSLILSQFKNYSYLYIVKKEILLSIKKVLAMGKQEIELRIKFLETLRETYIRVSKVDGRDKERVLKNLQEIDSKIALLILQKESLK